MRYRHTQVGWVVIVCLLAAAGVAVPAVVLTGEPVIGGVIVGVLLLVLALFSTLTVTVDERELVARFGLGPIRRRIALEDVASYATVRNSWWYGWGVRMYPGGWMYNISGLDAVELVLRSGKRFRVGTDEPRELAAALGRVVGEPEPAAPADLARERRRTRRTAALIGGLVTLVMTGVGAVLWGESRPTRATLEGDRLSVSSFIYSDELTLAEIEHAGLCEHLPTIAARTNGTAMGSLLRGSFRLEDGTRARIYVDHSKPPFVAVRHAGGLLLFQGDAPRETRALYERLRSGLDGG